MSDYAAEVHEALRLAGLVSESEDVHWLACSTDYRMKMIHAFDGESPSELSAELAEVHRYWLSPDDTDDLKSEHAAEVASLLRQIDDLEKQLEQLRQPAQETAAQ